MPASRSTPDSPDPASSAITDAEWDLLEALWERGRGTAREIAEDLSATRKWAYSTVKTMLDRMVEKKLVASRQVGNVWEYTPAVERAEARRSAWRRFVGAAFGGAMDPALRFIAGEANLTRKQREALLALLADEERGKSKGKGDRGDANQEKSRD